MVENRRNRGEIMIHIMKIQEQYFHFIKKGTKKYEIRLNDEKRQKIKIGDFIEFQKEPLLEEKIIVEVENMLYYDNFSKLFDDIKFDYLADSSLSKEDLQKDLELFYPIEKQQIYGVVAIQLKKDNIINYSKINNIFSTNEIFTTLRDDYNDFDTWLRKMKLNNVNVFYTEWNDKITSILMLKINEMDSQQFFLKGKILKIRTFLVLDKNKGIGTMYLKIIDDIAKVNTIKYIYLTIKIKNNEFIQFIEKNNYKKYSQLNDELVYYKVI